MHSVVRLIRSKPGVSATELEALARAQSQEGSFAEIVHRFIGPTMPGVRNGGDLIWHLVFDDRAASERWALSRGRGSDEALGAAAAHIDSASFDHGPGGARRPDLKPGIYRALFFSLASEATPEQARQLELDLLAMPQHIDAILNWRLSRVSAASGTAPWSYVWEQEFAQLQHLTQDYVWHPYHWGYVDRWFDPEMPCRIVRNQLCHTFARIDSSVLMLARP